MSSKATGPLLANPPAVMGRCCWSYVAACAPPVLTPPAAGGCPPSCGRSDCEPICAGQSAVAASNAVQQNTQWNRFIRNPCSKFRMSSRELSGREQVYHAFVVRGFRLWVEVDPSPPGVYLITHFLSIAYVK